MYNQPTETGQEESKKDSATPLTRGNPHLIAEQHENHQAEVRWIEQMLVSAADEKLAGDGEHRSC